MYLVQSSLQKNETIHPKGGHIELAGKESGVGAQGVPLGGTPLAPLGGAPLAPLGRGPLGGGPLPPLGTRGGPRPCKPLTHNEEYYEVKSKSSN